MVGRDGARPDNAAANAAYRLIAAAPAARGSLDAVPSAQPAPEADIRPPAGSPAAFPAQ